MSTNYEFDRKLGGAQLRIAYSYSPGTPDRYYLPNGDPGYPGDPEEISVDFVGLKVGEALLDITELLEELGCFEDESGNRLFNEVCKDIESRLQDDLEERAADDIEAEVWEGREFP